MTKTTFIALLLVFIGLPCAAQGQTLRVGIYDNPPKISLDENGEPTGFFVDILESLAAAEGWQIDWVKCEWEVCLASLENGKLDLMPDVAFSNHRAERFDFHEEPVIDAYSRVYAAKDEASSFGDLASLHDRRVAVLRGSMQQRALATRSRGLSIDAEIIPVESYDAAFAKVASGEVDAAIANQFYGDRHARELELGATPIVLLPTYLFYATTKGRHADVLQAIDARLVDWKTNAPSPYYDALTTWTGPGEPREEVPMSIWGVLGVGAVALLLGSGVILALRRQVGERDRVLASRDRALRLSEGRARLVVHHIPLAAEIWRCDNGTIRLEATNERAGTTFGVSETGVLLGTAHAARPSLVAAIEQGFERDESWQSMEALATSNGEREFALSFGRLDPERVMALYEDITERKELEERLATAQRLRTAGLLAGGVAHDFNNLLTVIRGNAEMAQDELQPESTLFEHLGEIELAATKAAEMTKQLLVFSRRQYVEPEPVDFGAIIREVRGIYGRLVEESVEVAWDVADEPLVVVADASRLEQVVMNLLLNARDAVEQQGRVTIRLCRDGDFALLEVEDDGCGMDAETKRQAVEPFFSTKDGQGTGLGLSTVFTAVDEAGGALSIESELGAGTVVSVRLPLSDRESSTEEHDGLGQVSGRGHFVLVVEDEPGVRRVMERMLRDLDFDVHGVADGAAALAYLEQSEQVDMLITDVVMPGMTGKELADEVATRWGELPTLFVSGYTDAQLEPRGVESGQVHLLQKPFTREDLVRALARFDLFG